MVSGEGEQAWRQGCGGFRLAEQVALQLVAVVHTRQEVTLRFGFNPLGNDFETKGVG